MDKMHIFYYSRLSSASGSKGLTAKYGPWVVRLNMNGQ